MIKGMIFDFDGLMVDTESVWYEAYKEVMLERHGAQLALDRYSACIGTGSSVIQDYLCELAGKEVDVKDIKCAALPIFENKMRVPVLREGVLDYLKEAKSLGLKIGLASSSKRKWVESYLRTLDVLSYFQVIRTREDVVKVKPDPELYRRAAADLGLLPDEIIAFEDSLNGLTAAKRAGLHCIIVPNPVTGHLPFAEHDYRLASMGEESLGRILKRFPTESR